MQDLREQYDGKVAEAEGILDAAAAEKRGLTAEETTKHDELIAEARGLRQLISRQDAVAKEREEIVPELRAARAAVEMPREERSDAPRVDVTHRDPGHYTKRSSNSFFVDKALAELKNDPAARRRLEENSAAVRDAVASDEKRDLYNAATAGQEIVPPLYLTDLFVEARVAGAVAAGLCNQLPLPEAGRSVTVPKMTGSTAVGIQTEASPLTALTETDATTAEETQGIYEIAGVQDLSNFLVDRSTPGADMVIMRNLAKQVAAKLDYYVLHGDGTGEPQGIRGATGINAVTYTASTPTFAEAQAKIADAVQQVHAGWFESPNAIVVHPRRWAKWMSERDSDGRPLGANAAYAVNPMALGQIGGTPQGGPAGLIHGIPVYLDSNISATLGAGTNEDTVFCFVREQALLWLGALNLEIDRSVNFKTSGVAVRARQYAAFMVEHAPEAFATVSGTGLAAPTFA